MAIYSEFHKVLDYLARECHDNAVKHGFYDGYLRLEDYLIRNEHLDWAEDYRRSFILEQLAKVDSEVGESVAVVQKSRDYSGLAEELADIVIRVFDLAAFANFDFGKAIIAKMEKNVDRPYKHGKLC